MSALQARCQCGALTVDLPGPSAAVVACHCLDCQRRTGAPFGVLAYYPAESVTIAGEAVRFARPTAEGNVFESFFCITCGSTVYVRAGRHPAMIGVSVGAISDPVFPPPVRSVWEQTRHAWVEVPAAERFERGRGRLA